MTQTKIDGSVKDSGLTWSSNLSLTDTGKSLDLYGDAGRGTGMERLTSAHYGEGAGPLNEATGQRLPFTSVDARQMIDNWIESHEV